MRRNRVYKVQGMDEALTLLVVAPNRTSAVTLAAEAFHGGRFTVKAETDADGRTRMTDDPAGVSEITPSTETKDNTGAGTDDGNLTSGGTAFDGLADVAETYIRRRRVERQSTQLTSRQSVTLTIIQNEWARQYGEPVLGIAEAPEQVIRAIETTRRGHELFDRQRDKADGTIAYALRKTDSRK